MMYAPLHPEQVAFLNIAACVVVALALVILGSSISARWRPHRPDPIKCSTYESGEEPTGNAWGRVNTRFYTLALIFLLFEVETILLFPWAVVYGHPGLVQATDGWWIRYTTGIGMLFLLTLMVGLLYVGFKGYLTWPNPKLPKTKFVSVIPDSYYDNINKQKSSPKPISLSES